MDISTKDFLNQIFPNLKDEEFDITSPCDPTYNCIAWAAEDNTKWWEPDPLGIYFWPDNIPRKYTIEAYRAVFEKYLGYSVTNDDNNAVGTKQIAMFVQNQQPTHASRFLSEKMWTSKLGQGVDIKHNLKGLCGDIYGDVFLVFNK